MGAVTAAVLMRLTVVASTTRVKPKHADSAYSVAGGSGRHYGCTMTNKPRSPTKVTIRQSVADALTAKARELGLGTAERPALSTLAVQLVTAGTDAILQGYDLEALRAADATARHESVTNPTIKVDSSRLRLAGYVTGYRHVTLAALLMSVIESPREWEEAAEAWLAGVRAVRKLLEGDDDPTPTC